MIYTVTFMTFQHRVKYPSAQQGTVNKTVKIATHSADINMQINNKITYKAMHRHIL